MVEIDVNCTECNDSASWILKYSDASSDEEVVVTLCSPHKDHYRDAKPVDVEDYTSIEVIGSAI